VRKLPICVDITIRLTCDPASVAIRIQGVCCFTAINAQPLEEVKVALNGTSTQQAHHHFPCIERRQKVRVVITRRQATGP
jgi:hypothetical protein